MNKKIFLTVTLAVLLAVSNSQAVLGQTAQSQEKKVGVMEKVQEARDALKNKVAEVKEKAKEKRAEVKKKLEAQRAKRVADFNQRMVTRFDASINRLENVASRLDSRLGKLAKEGKEVTAFRTALDGAKSKIASAKTALGEVKLSLEAVAVSETPQTDFEMARGKLDSVKDAIKQAHAALVDVVSSIKGSSKE